MNHLGLTVFAGAVPGIILDFNKESKEYTVEFEDGRVVKTAVVNWESAISPEPDVAQYRLANCHKDETIVFNKESGWDVVSLSRQYWETGAPHEVSEGEDYDDEHMRSDIGGNSVVRHVEKELYNNRKDEEGNPEQKFVDDAEDVVQMPPVPHDLESFMERAETAEPDPEKTDRQFPSGQYNERSRLPQHSHVREQAEWEDRHYANNLVCEDCGDPLVEGVCYGCCKEKNGISPEEYIKDHAPMNNARQANQKVSFAPLLALAAPIAEALGIGAGAAAAGEGAAAAGGLGGLAGKALGFGARGAIGQAVFKGGEDVGDALTGDESSTNYADGVPAYQSPFNYTSTTEPSSGTFAIEIDGINSHPENGGTGNYNMTHGDGDEYLKDVNDIGGTLSVIHDHVEADDIDSAMELVSELISEGIPAMIEFADKEDSGEDNPAIKSLDELFENVFGEEYTKARDEASGKEKKESKVAADQPNSAICRKCNRPVVIGQQACSNVPALPDCPVVSIEATNQPTQQPAPAAQPSQAPTSTVPQTLNFPVYPKITKTLRVVAARKPKMCPYHADLVDYAVALHDPGSALSALSQHLYTQNSCKGGWGEAEGTKCRFKPEMVLNEYWDTKARETEERKQQREEQKAFEQAQNPVMEETQEVEFEQPEIEEFYEDYETPQEETVVKTDNMTNTGDSSPSYNDYLPAENYADYGSAVDNGSYESAPAGDLVMASSRNWIITATSEDEGEDVRFYEYPGEDDYEEGSADGDRIQDSEGDELEIGSVYKIGPEGELPEVIKVEEINPQYIEVTRVDSAFPDDDGHPYIISLKDIMVQDLNIEKVDKLNPNEIGGDEHDALAGTPETMDDAGPGHQDGVGTTDLSGGRKASLEDHYYSVSNRDVKALKDRLESEKFIVTLGGTGHYTVYWNGVKVGNFSATPSDPRSLINSEKWIRRQVRILEQQAQGQDVEIGSRRMQSPQPPKSPKSKKPNKTAGYDYQPHEQKHFINEGGVARNLDKLDLEGTHYPEEMGFEDDDYFLFGA